jgi:hypothetical protein
MPAIYRKLLATGILLVLLTGTWVLLGEPYVDLWQDRIIQAERLQRKQLALRQLIENRQMFEQQLEALSDSEGLQQVFLDEKTGALADVKLQRIVKQIVADSGAKVIQAVIRKKKAAQKTKPAAFTETEEDKSVTVQVIMQGSLEMVYSALQALENSRPLILIGNLEIAHIKSRYRAAQSEDSDTSYRASYDATAFIL